MHAARRIGMIDTPDRGIDITDESRQAAARIPPFGTNRDTTTSLLEEKKDIAPLVFPEDKEELQISDYLYLLLSQVQRVRLSSAERVGNRKSLRIGLPGFGCRYCCQKGRLGLSRIFPARRRTLPSKIPDLHDHLRRCTLCPSPIKNQLEVLYQKQLKEKEKSAAAGGSEGSAVIGNEREFYSRIWSRLGHGDRPEP
jgi:hypothetical protein